MSKTSHKLLGAMVAAGLVFGFTGVASASTMSTCKADYKAGVASGKIAKTETWKTYYGQCAKMHKASMKTHAAKKTAVHKVSTKKTMTKAPATTATKS